MGTTEMVALVFTDLVGSTELASSIGPARADDLRRAHFRTLTEAAEAGNGTVVKNLGDGLMVTFRSAADAVTAAVGMQQAVEAHTRGSRNPLAIRIGIAVGDTTHEDDDWFGLPVTEAARLCDVAETGQILATDTVRALAQPRVGEGFKPSGLRELKGLPNAVPVCEVVWEPRPAGFELGAALLGSGRQRAKLVGRASELDQLAEAWNTVSATGPRLILVAGEPGIGKTRLALELAARVTASQGTVLAGHCYEDAVVPYQPFVEALRQQGHELQSLMPDTSDPSAVLPAGVPPGPEADRYLFFEAVASLLRDLAASAPTLLIVDDLHWADRASLLLLRYLARQPGPSPLLILGTYRETELGRSHPLEETLAELRREQAYERVALHGLDQPATAALIESWAGQSPPPALVAAIHEETEGNPFFTEEVLFHLQSTGAVPEGGAPWVADARTIAKLGIPEGIRQAVGRRLNRLGDEANRVLAVAAVLGREFAVDALEHTSGVATDPLLDALDEATAAGLVAEIPGHAGRYAFAHALIRQTLYDELSAARRLRLHQKAGEVFEVLYAGDIERHLDELALHFSQLAYGGDVDKAVAYCMRAGQAAANVMAWDEAAHHFERALQALEVADAQGDERHCDVLTALAETALVGRIVAAYTKRDDSPAHQALRLARTLGDVRRMGLAAAVIPPLGFRSGEEVVATIRDLLTEPVIQEDLQLRSRLLQNLAGHVSTTTGFSHEERAEFNRRALEAAADVGDPTVLAIALWTEYFRILATPLYDPDRTEAILLQIEGLAPHDHSAERMSWVGRLRQELVRGNLEAAAARAADYERAAHELRRPYGLFVAEAVKAHLSLLHGDLGVADDLATAAIALGRDVFGDVAVATYGFFLWALRREQGRLAEMEAPMRHLVGTVHAHPGQYPAITAAFALTLLETQGPEAALPVYNDLVDSRRWLDDLPSLVGWANLSECTVVIGTPEVARELYERMTPFDGELVIAALYAFSAGPVARYIGMLAGYLGDFDAAERHLADSLAMCERLDAPGWMARTQRDWAAVLGRRGGPGDRDKALELLGVALDTSRSKGLAGIELLVRADLSATA